jgi:hypothetical protein
MATREELHRVIDELPEAELDSTLELLVSKTGDESGEPQEIVVDARQAERILDALDHPERFEAGLRRLMSSAGKRASKLD